MAKKKMDKLSQEVAMALAAGMSYGKWKAMQAPAKITPKTDMPEGWRKCEWCGTWYKPKTKRPQKFCELSCQVNCREARRKQKDAEYKRGYILGKKAEADG